MAHAVALLDRTSNGALREALLRLVHALLVPACAATSDAASRVASANGAAFVSAGGVQLAVDLVAGAPARNLQLVFVGGCPASVLLMTQPLSLMS